MKGSEYCPAHKLKKYISGSIGVFFTLCCLHGRSVKMKVTKRFREIVGEEKNVCEAVLYSD